MKVKKFYPIGTIVELKRNDRANNLKVIIIGRYLSVESENIVYDYLGVIYPYGYLDDKAVLFFYEEAIQKVVDLGFEDEKDDEFKELLNVVKQFGIGMSSIFGQLR